MKAILKAITDVTAEIPNLAKAEKNQHGGYNFVPIDKYYEVVGKAAAKHGLSWSLSEHEWEHLPNVGKSGAMRFTYVTRLMHSSGEQQDNFSRLTIIHPIQGAQTAGSAMSYADKVFTRQLFKVQTGEQDADSTNPNDFEDTKPAPQKHKPEAKQEPEAAEIARKMAGNLASEEQITELVSKSGGPIGETQVSAVVYGILKHFVTSEDQLPELWAENKESFNKVKAHKPSEYDAIVEMFKNRRAELKGKQQ